jgi:AcrR family transcriptional regulator
MTLPSTDQHVKRIYAPRMPLEQRRQQILEAALDEYLERGFANARIDSIAEKVGVSKPVLYGAFESKEAIAAAVVEEAHRREALLNIEADDLGAFALVGEGRVIPLYRVVFHIANENRRLYEFLYSDFRGAPPEAIAVHDQVFEMRNLGISHYLSMHFADQPDSAEVVAAAAAMLSTVGRLGMTRVGRGEIEDVDHLAEVNGGLVERAIALD